MNYLFVRRDNRTLTVDGFLNSLWIRTETRWNVRQDMTRSFCDALSDAADRDLTYLQGYPTSFMFPLARAMVERNFSTALSAQPLSVLN